MNHQKSEKKSKLTFFVALLVLVLALVQLFISYRLATAGEIVSQLELKADQIKQKNVLLEEEISRQGSLAQISQKAQEQGFVKNSQVLYLTPEIPVAMGN